MSDWRAARSILTLRDQVDALYPGRDKSSDGTIGDAAHQATTSQHNPNAAGVVTAIDITNDPAHGLVSRDLAQKLLDSRDPRLWYVISNNEIAASNVEPKWQWRPYSGPNPHTEHMHLSVSQDPGLYDDPSFWNLSGVPTNIYPKSVPNGVQRGIIATTFGGASDPQASAYDGHPISDTEMGVALPYHFPGVRPKVRVTHLGQPAIGAIVDVGPWNTNDPYWVTGARPQAESGTDMHGRKTNFAGIDLTPAMARAVGSDGKVAVDWEFVTATPVPPPPDPIPPPPGPTPMPNTPFEDCLAEMAASDRAILTKYWQVQLTPDQLLAVIIQRLGGTALPPPVTPVPPTPDPAPVPPPVTPTPPASTPINQTPSVQLSALALALSTLLQSLGVIGTPLGMGQAPTDIGTAATIGPILTGLVGAAGGWSGLGKVLLTILGSLAPKVPPK